VTEVELKFDIEPGAHRLLRRSAALAGAAPVRRRLRSTYFDSPECELAARGMALRLRREGRRWIACLKSGASGTGGLHAREEWEHEEATARIDLARFAATPLADLDHARTLHERLVPVFEVDMVRTTWTLAPLPGVRLEVALDAGSVESQDVRATLSEVEIECLEGGADGAFELALQLMEDVALRPSAVTKAERGYLLFTGAARQARKARPVVLEASMTPAAAARRVIGAGLDQLLANEEGLLGSSDPEFVHQARIGLRRVRSAVRMFRDVIGAERALEWRREFADVSRTLGSARDWDVFALEVLPPLVRAHGDGALGRTLARRVARRRGVERAAGRSAIRSRRHGRAILELSRWLAQDEPRPGAGAAHLVDFASELIRKRHKRLMRLGARVAELSIAERHHARILAKRLRYGTDAFASLFKSKKVAQYHQALVTLQDVLGGANDAATAARLLTELATPESFAAFGRGWCAAHAEVDPARLEALFGELARCRRFWRGKPRPAKPAPPIPRGPAPHP
jgi:inorganic triphosphatase YgiF